MPRHRPARALRRLSAVGLAVAMGCTGGVVAQGAEASSGPSKQTTRNLAGVYAGPCDIADLHSWEKVVGGRPAVVSEFLDGRSWQTLSDPDYFMRCWTPELGASSRLALGVPLLPDQGASLAQGATGAYDGYFRTLAERLVAGGGGSSYLRVGWEFNGDWQPWRAAADPQAFVTFYRRVVQTMRSVPGARFSFVWSPNYGYTESDALGVWPGDDVVDAVGISAYDQGYRPDYSYPLPLGASARTVAQRRVNAWKDIAHGYRGLDTFARFARNHHKPVAIAEWGLARNSGPGSDVHGGGDNPYFVTQFHAWMLKNKVIWATYWNDTNGWDGRVTKRPNGQTLLKHGAAQLRASFRIRR